MQDVETLARFEEAVAALSEALSPSDVFKSLLDGSRLGASRAAVFLIRQGSVRGWGSTGYDINAARRLRDLHAPADDGWFGRVVRSTRGRLDSGQPGEVPPQFGQSPAVESVLLPIRLGGKCVALLLAERLGGAPSLQPSFLSILTVVAEIRLDLDLHRRKLGARERAASPEPAAAASPPAEEPVPAPVTDEPVAVPMSEEPVAVPMSEEPVAVPMSEAPVAVPLQDEPVAAPEKPASGTPQFEIASPEELDAGPAELAPSGPTEDPELAPVRRYARLIATDIRLYNEEAVVLGRKQGDLAKRLSEHLKRGAETFARRYGNLGENGREILHDAYVQVLAGGDAGLLPGLDSD